MTNVSGTMAMLKARAIPTRSFTRLTIAMPPRC
jgi:hypothetical protein